MSCTLAGLYPIRLLEACCGPDWVRYSPATMAHSRCHPLGLFLALFALMTQIALGASVPQVQPALAGFGAICHAGGNDGPAPTAPAQHAPDCMACLRCAAIGVPLTALADAPDVPLPSLVFIAPAVVLPPATAPPARKAQQAQPRGPPVLT